jgi:uncharacterized membrane protein
VPAFELLDAMFRPFVYVGMSKSHTVSQSGSVVFVFAKARRTQKPVLRVFIDRVQLVVTSVVASLARWERCRIFPAPVVELEPFLGSDDTGPTFFQPFSSPPRAQFQ